MGEAGGKLRQQADLMQGVHHLFMQVFLIFVEMMVQQALSNDILHLGALIQRSHGILEDHLDLTDDLLVQFLGNLAVDLLALEEDVAAGGRVDAADGTANGGLTGAGLADQREGLALIDVKVDMIDSNKFLLTGAKGDLKVFQLNQLFAFSHLSWRLPSFPFSHAGSGWSAAAQSWERAGPDTRSLRRGSRTPGRTEALAQSRLPAHACCGAQMRHP